MNDVGRSFFLLRSAGLTERQLFDLRLRVDGDLSRYNDITQLLARMFADGSKTRTATVPSMASQYFQEPERSFSSWEPCDWDYDAWNSDIWYGHDSWDDSWYGYDDANWYEDTWSSIDTIPELDQSSESVAAEYWGKGKSKGKSSPKDCTKCGSKWHSETDCPVNSSETSGKSSHKGKSKGKGFKGSKGKSYLEQVDDYENLYGKGKGKKGKGFGKGNGKGKRRKGKGKGKGSFRRSVFMLEDGPA